MKKNIFIFAAAGAACLAAGFFFGKYKKAKEEEKEGEIPDCGGCFNNCSLAAPGCRIGFEKAQKYRAEHPDYQE